MKLKESAPSHQYKHYYGQKVWTVCMSDVEWIEVEHAVKTEPVANIVKEMEHIQISLSAAAQDEGAKYDLEQKMQQLLAKLQRMT